MTGSLDKVDTLQEMAGLPRVRLATLPTPIQPLPRLSARLGGPDIWLKRDDLTGLPGGGNKTRKLEFLIGDALEQGCDTLLTIGAIQSNHTRQTAAAAAKAGLGCALLHCHWAPDGGPYYRKVGNVLLSALLGAELFLDEEVRFVGDETTLEVVAGTLRGRGRKPFVIPCGGSEIRFGGLGYAVCAAEIAHWSEVEGIEFDAIVHTTGSSSTQAGLIAGYAALRKRQRIVGVADDEETNEKRRRVLRLASRTVDELSIAVKINPSDVEVIVADPSPYGVASPAIVDAIRLLAETEGVISDPVYEGRAIKGLIDLIEGGTLTRGQRVLLLHLGGQPAVDAFADRLWSVNMQPLQGVAAP